MVQEPQKTENGVQLGHVEFIWARNSKEFFFSNSILIHDSQATVVDPSANFSYLEHLAASKRVHQVLNTHYHVDHRSLNSLFKEARFLCHKLDIKPLQSFENYLRFADSVQDSGYIEWLKGIFSTLDIKEAYFDTLLSDGQLLPLEDHEVQVVHLPGHTPGHIGLLFKEIDLFFCSDVDLTPLGPWYANLSSNIDDFLKSLEKIKEIQCRYYATSHGSRIYDPEQFFEKLARFEAAIPKREEKILEALKEQPQELKHLSEIGIIYKHSHLEKDPLKASFERQMIEKHLERLKRLGTIQEDRGLWHLS